MIDKENLIFQHKLVKRITAFFQLIILKCLLYRFYIMCIGLHNSAVLTIYTESINIPNIPITEFHVSYANFHLPCTMCLMQSLYHVPCSVGAQSTVENILCLPLCFSFIKYTLRRQISIYKRNLYSQTYFLSSVDTFSFANKQIWIRHGPGLYNIT